MNQAVQQYPVILLIVKLNQSKCLSNIRICLLPVKNLLFIFVFANSWLISSYPLLTELRWQFCFTRSLIAFLYMAIYF